MMPGSSPAMLQRARAKAAGAGLGADGAVTVAFVRADAQHPPLRPGGVDAVLARHVLWALPDPELTLRRWLDLLRPGGTAMLTDEFGPVGRSDGHG